MAEILYPIGIQTFEKIRSDNYLYVDKTKYVYELTHRYSYVFLSRPRRFGKSLFTSTLESYFEGRKDLFAGLEIDRLETEWKKHPVFHFDMSEAKSQDIETTRTTLHCMVCKYEKEYGKCPDSEGIADRLRWLYEAAYKKTGQKVVVLIDEYDAPMLEVMHDEEKLQGFRDLFRSFYAPIKSCDKYIRFGFITGITKFSQLSIFSEINNLARISMTDQWSGICGITQKELETNLSEEIEKLSDSLGLSKDETLNRLKEFYDGYHFSEKSEDVYNPFSMITAFERQKLNNYWFETATPNWLISKLNSVSFKIEDLEGAECKLSDFDLPAETTKNVWPLLYQSGYVTIKEYNQEENLYVLGYPNAEVRNGMLSSLLPYYIGEGQSVLLVEKLGKNLKEGDIANMMHRLRTLFAEMPYFIAGKTERHFQAMFYLIFKLLTNAKVESEVSSARGRVDAIVETNHTVYVFEFKLDQSAAKALEQIDQKGYAIPYENDPRDIVKIGANFDSGKRTLTEWIIESRGIQTEWNDTTDEE